MALKTHAGPAGPLAFLPDGRALITGGADGSLRRWDLADGHLQALRIHAHRRAGRGLRRVLPRQDPGHHRGRSAS